MILDVNKGLCDPQMKMNTSIKDTSTLYEAGSYLILNTIY